MTKGQRAETPIGVDVVEVNLITGALVEKFKTTFL